MNPIVEVNVQSEIGKLNGVIIHTPGEEVENMTPENAERALYSDIINLSIARKEYKQICPSFSSSREENMRKKKVGSDT